MIRELKISLIKIENDYNIIMGLFIIDEPKEKSWRLERRKL